MTGGGECGRKRQRVPPWSGGVVERGGGGKWYTRRRIKGFRRTRRRVNFSTRNRRLGLKRRGAARRQEGPPYARRASRRPRIEPTRRAASPYDGEITPTARRPKIFNLFETSALIKGRSAWALRQELRRRCRELVSAKHARPIPKQLRTQSRVESPLEDALSRASSDRDQ